MAAHFEVSVSLIGSLWRWLLSGNMWSWPGLACSRVCCPPQRTRLRCWRRVMDPGGGKVHVSTQHVNESANKNRLKSPQKCLASESHFNVHRDNKPKREVSVQLPGKYQLLFTAKETNNGWKLKRKRPIPQRHMITSHYTQLKCVCVCVYYILFYVCVWQIDESARNKHDSRGKWIE